jgi:hypothetical protein
MFKLLVKHLIIDIREPVNVGINKLITSCFTGFLVGMFVVLGNAICYKELLTAGWGNQSAWLMTNGIFGLSTLWIGFWFLVLAGCMSIAPVFFQLYREDKARGFFRNIL